MLVLGIIPVFDDASYKSSSERIYKKCPSEVLMAEDRCGSFKQNGAATLKSLIMCS
jgi:hypothetical protein